MKSLGYVHTPVTEHHRWTPYSRRPIAGRQGAYSHAARLMLHQMRWRKPPRQYGLKTLAALVSILVHVVGLVAMLLVRPPPMATPGPVGQQEAIQVRFIESRAPPPPPPIPALPKPTGTPHQARRVAATPSRAPRHAAVPVPPREKPRVQVEVKPRTVTVATPAIEPAKVAAVAPEPAPVKQALPEVAVPPPRVVTELSPMAVPPPKVRVDVSAPVTAVRAVKAVEQPLPVPRPDIRPQAPQAAKLEVPQTAYVPTPAASVTVAPGAPPLPSIAAAASVAITPTPLPAPAVSVPRAAQPATPASIAPVAAASQALPAAPLSAPAVQIARVQAPAGPRVESPTVKLSPVPKVVRATPAPARVMSVSPPARTSWAQQSDTFSKLPARQPGQGSGQQASDGSPQGVPDYIQRQPQGNSDVMTRQYKGFHYKRTIFDQYWAPANQDLLTSLLQRLVDALSFHKTFDLGHGVRIHCGGWLLGFGCGGDAPDPMSKMSNDRRLNMAPAKPLVPGLGASVAPPPSAPPPQSSEQSVTCETARVAGGPLPPECKAGKP